MIKQTKGITLIALIITIIILIILTAVTINNVMGTDLIGFATKAVENYTDAEKDEADKVDKLTTALDNQGVSDDSIVRAGETVTAETKAETDDGGIKYNYTDAQGRHAMVPAGFKVSTKQDEQYIKDGLVIQDSDGNEFVWVPCYYETKPKNAPSDLQEYKNHDYQLDNTWMIWQYDPLYWKDDAAISYGNESVEKYGGFYIGRYEAGWPDSDTSKFTNDTVPYITDYNTEATKKNITNKKPISKPNVFAWNFINQQNAKTVSELMYSDSDSVNSKLIDGTAWDTMVSWIISDGIDDGLYGNYSNTNKSYTGWYAEHVTGAGIKQNTGESCGWMYARNYLKGQIQLQSVNLSSDNGKLWNDKKNNYTDFEKADASKQTLTTRIEIPTGSYEDFKLKNVYDMDR